MPNTKDINNKAVLECFMPWSKDIPQSCRIGEQDLDAPDPLDIPNADISPTLLDLDN